MWSVYCSVFFLTYTILQNLRFFRFSRSISFNEEFYITLQHIIALTKMRCCELFFKTVARRPILVAVCMAIFALFLSMVGMSKFEIATEVKTGRDEYSPEGSKFTQRNDAVTLARKELERPLSVQDQQSITSEDRADYVVDCAYYSHVIICVRG